MIQLQKSFLKLLCRFRYPISLPEDLAHDLGLFIPNTITFQDFIHFLRSPQCQPTRLRKYMSRWEAESLFVASVKKECFPSRTLFSYHLGKGWVVITLYFGDNAELRRATVQFPQTFTQEVSDLFLLEEERNSSMGVDHFQRLFSN